LPSIEEKYNDLRIINKHILGKLIRKNRGNLQLMKSVQQLISDIENNDWKTPHELTEKRPDADCVYGGEFYFFNINIHRTLILIEFEENGDATIVWAGSHDDYEQTFKNNRNVIKKWLRDNNWI
jgi:mRNA-degrading endonuclease HigB of HigAB toxin-antitoxin module